MNFVHIRQTGVNTWKYEWCPVPNLGNINDKIQYGKQDEGETSSHHDK